VNGQNYSASSPNCQKQVSFSPPIVLTSAPTPTPPTPTPPAAVTSLVNTGPGNVLGIFTLATILGTLGYRRMLSRHIGRN
jgi:hypothetical protein